jgi:hypothetical protein
MHSSQNKNVLVLLLLVSYLCKDSFPKSDSNTPDGDSS